VKRNRVLLEVEVGKRVKLRRRTRRVSQKAGEIAHSFRSVVLRSCTPDGGNQKTLITFIVVVSLLRPLLMRVSNRRPSTLCTPPPPSCVPEGGWGRGWRGRRSDTDESDKRLSPLRAPLSPPLSHPSDQYFQSSQNLLSGRAKTPIILPSRTRASIFIVRARAVASPHFMLLPTSFYVAIANAIFRLRSSHHPPITYH
jgi:hypothetical protein